MSSVVPGVNFVGILNGENPAGVPPIYCEEYRKKHAALTSLKRKVEQLNASSVPHRITGKLNEEDLPKLLDARHPLRKWIVVTYNRLRDQNQLHLLELPTNDLYTYKSGYEFSAHQAIEPIAKECDADESGSLLAVYQKVIRLTQLLKSGTVNPLRKDFFEEECKLLEGSLAFSKLLIERDYEAHRTVQQNNKRKVADFPEGDFSFVPDAESKKYFEIAYKELNRANKWDALKEFGKSHRAFFSATNDSALLEVFDPVKKAGADSGCAMSIVVSNMLYLAGNGWEAFVSAFLER